MAYLHTKLCNLVIKTIQRRLGNDVRIFKRHLGLVYTLNGQPMKLGVTGQFDVWGYVASRPRAVPFEIEIKVGDDDVRKGQEAWSATMEHLGVPVMVLHAANEEAFREAAQDAAAWVTGLKTAPGMVRVTNNLDGGVNGNRDGG
ncbi:MAG: hypothetical protein IPL77_11055 [Flavobacteriales bacterium]|nr:hypothetical protein [Flavobacteriales bacterium]